MEYRNIANLLNNESNQPSKFRTRNWNEINDDSRGTYTGNIIKIKTTMLRSNLCEFRCIHTRKWKNNNCWSWR